MEIYVKFNSAVMNADEIFLKTASLSDHLQSKILKYDATEKKQQRIEGLELLQNAFVLNKLNPREFNPDCIRYNSFGKPFINSEIDFSLSYHGNNTVLAFIENGIIGTDIELIKHIDFENYKFLFTDNERRSIETSTSPNSFFFKLWTRKEALTKALGMGAFLDFSSFEVIEDEVVIKNQLIYISSKLVQDKYWLSVANNKRSIDFSNMQF